MSEHRAGPRRVLIVAVPETAGSALYGMLEVLAVAGTVWHELTGSGPGHALFSVAIVSPDRRRFLCANRIPVQPDVTTDEAPAADIVILPELWLAPSASMHGRYPALIDWVRERYAGGSAIYSACSGAILLAETGLLDGCEATSHWAYTEFFQREYPAVHFHPEPNLVFAEAGGRIVTAGGTTSWHDLALHIIARYGGPEEATRIAQVYLLKWHGEGQLPFTPLLPVRQHGDAIVRRCEDWLEQHYREHDVIPRVIEHSGLTARTLKRRFKAATGLALLDCVQNLRVEAAKRLLESTRTAVDDISVEVGYEDPSFFRRLFKRRTGVTPRDYRRLFQPVRSAQPGRSPDRLPSGTSAGTLRPGALAEVR
jgi:transcriptional regulator GlxA family with amidase domain